MIRVVPFDHTVPIPTLGAFEILYLGDDTQDDPEANAIMYRESGYKDEIVDNADDLSRHRDIFENLWNVLPDEVASAEMLERRVKALLPSGA